MIYKNIKPHIDFNNIKLGYAKNEMVKDPIHVLKQVCGSIIIMQIILKMNKIMAII